jgi:hypothetical protein
MNPLYLFTMKNIEGWSMTHHLLNYFLGLSAQSS